MKTKNATTTVKPLSAKRKCGYILVPVLATIMIPVPSADAHADGDNGLRYAKECAQDLEMKLAGVPVKVRPS